MTEPSPTTAPAVTAPAVTEPGTLRLMAAAYDQKAARLFYDGKFAEADTAWDRAIDLRVQANAVEDARSRR